MKRTIRIPKVKHGANKQGIGTIRIYIEFNADATICPSVITQLFSKYFLQQLLIYVP
jgi:hypothetical protein